MDNLGVGGLHPPRLFEGYLLCRADDGAIRADVGARADQHRAEQFGALGDDGRVVDHGFANLPVAFRQMDVFDLFFEQPGIRCHTGIGPGDSRDGSVDDPVCVVK